MRAARSNLLKDVSTSTSSSLTFLILIFHLWTQTLEANSSIPSSLTLLLTNSTLEQEHAIVSFLVDLSDMLVLSEKKM